MTGGIRLNMNQSLQQKKLCCYIILPSRTHPHDPPPPPSPLSVPVPALLPYSSTSFPSLVFATYTIVLHLPSFPYMPHLLLLSVTEFSPFVSCLPQFLSSRPFQLMILLLLSLPLFLLYIFFILHTLVLTYTYIIFVSHILNFKHCTYRYTHYNRLFYICYQCSHNPKCRKETFKVRIRV